MGVAHALLLCHFDIILDARMCRAARPPFIAACFAVFPFPFTDLSVFNSYRIYKLIILLYFIVISLILIKVVAGKEFCSFFNFVSVYRLCLCCCFLCFMRLFFWILSRETTTTWVANWRYAKDAESLSLEPVWHVPLFASSKRKYLFIVVVLFSLLFGQFCHHLAVV